MHQMVSIISAFVLSPVNWVFAFLIASFLIRNKRLKKVFRFIAAGIFLVFSSPLLQQWYAGKWQAPRSTINTAKVYSCGIVLGGFASVDSDSFPYFNGAADRFIQALKLFKAGEITHILISGGNGKNENKQFGEAAFVKQELMTMGVPEAAILTEDRSTTTADNARYSKALIDSLRLPPPYLLITSAAHMPRASLLFKKAGLITEPFACNYTAGYKHFSWSLVITRFNVLLDWDAYLKEAAGYWWYK